MKGRNKISFNRKIQKGMKVVGIIISRYVGLFTTAFLDERILFHSSYFSQNNDKVGTLSFSHVLMHHHLLDNCDTR